MRNTTLITDAVIERVIEQVTDLVGDALDHDRVSAHIAYRFRVPRYGAKAVRAAKKSEARAFLAMAAVEAILGIASIDADRARRAPQ